MATFLLENSALRLTVAPQGASILTLEALEYQQPILHPGEKALFPMLPVANRVAGNRFVLQGQTVVLPESPVDERFFLHGDGWLKAWQVEGYDSHSICLGLTSKHVCGFDYAARITYQLVGNQFIAEMTLTHQGTKPIVYGVGFHPFFHLTPKSLVQFGATGFWPEGEHHLPQAWQGELPPEVNFITPKTPDTAWLNVGYSGWSGKAIIKHDAMNVELTCDTPYLMVFRMADEPFICLEPQSHPVNAHNMAGQPGLVLLSQGESTRMKMEIAVTMPD